MSGSTSSVSSDSSSSPPPRKCNHCYEKVAKSVCSQCKTIVYCSRECQRANWKTHKKVCKFISQVIKGDLNNFLLYLHSSYTIHFDDILDFATQHMNKVEKFTMEIANKDDNNNGNLQQEKGKVDLSPNSIHNFIKSAVDQLVEITWSVDEMLPTKDHNNNNNNNITCPMTDNGQVWKVLGDCSNLKSIVMDNPVFAEVSYLTHILQLRTSTLMELRLDGLILGRSNNGNSDWSDQDCNELACAISNCQNLVKLVLVGIDFRDTHINNMLKVSTEGLTTSLRCLTLAGRSNNNNNITSQSLSTGATASIVAAAGGGGYLTNLTCFMIAQRCPNLQSVNLNFHSQITQQGIEQMLDRCMRLREFHSSVDVHPDMLSKLLLLFPDLVVWGINSHHVSRDKIKALRRVVEARNGQINFVTQEGKMLDFQHLSRGARAGFNRTEQLVRGLEEDLNCLGIYNEWEPAFGHEIVN